jgi:hypothetical protein
MSTPPPPKAKSTEEHLADIHTIIDNMATSMAMMQGNQGQLAVAVNRLQSDKLTPGDGTGPSHQDPITTVARHGHKLLFPTYDGKDDPLPWLNRCGQFFRIQATEDAGKVFLTSFYMTGDAAQWCAFLEKNQGTPTSDEFEKLVNQRFGPPIHGNALGELIQLR